MLLALLLSIAASPTDALFTSVARTDTPGCMVDVRRRGEVIVQQAYGMADLELPRPITADTVFEAGSVSKQFTGALVALLAARGALSLDDSVRHWLPELPALYEPVTIAMLMHHTSGVRDWGVLAELSGWPRGSRAYAMDDAIGLVARQQALNFKPGEEYLYSNSNYLLAARIVERASGRPFAALATDELFSPLGMTHTRWRSDFRTLVPDRAQAYSADAGGAWTLDMPFEDVVGPGGLLTTTGDLQRWNAALDAGRFEGARRMTEPGRLNDGAAVNYGMGLELGAVDGRPALSHAGSTAGYRAWLGRFPQDGLSVALLCNAGSLNTEALGPRVAALFLPRAAAPAPPSAPEASPADRSTLFRNLATDTAVTVVTTAEGLRIGDLRFLKVSDDVFRTTSGRQATLRRDAAGRISGLEVTRPGNAPQRLEPASAWSPDAAQLGAAAGIYESSEVEGRQRLVWETTGLRWVDPRGLSQPLRPTLDDTFVAPESGWVLRLLRDGRGQITGLRASLGRARAINFRRAVLK